MRWWKLSTILMFAAALGALGCGSNKSSGVSITISPTIASVITNRTQPFSGLVTGSSNTAITWSWTCATGVAASACGSIDASGLYTAPATIPTVTSGSTTTIAPTVTIKATAQADTTKTATASLTIVTGISISITPTSATVGTTETLQFSKVVTNPGCNLVSNPTCEDVKWSVPTPPAATTACPNPSSGKIDPNTGVYTAPSSVPCPSSTIIITATSVADTSVTATATVTVVTATNPTVTSVSPNTTALGGLFQDVYITGTNFISTNKVLLCSSTALTSCLQLSPGNVSVIDSKTIRARIPDSFLAAPPSPSAVFQVGVSEQSGQTQTCPAADASPCKIFVVAVRPGVVGPAPDSIPQGTAGVQTFGVDGGFFGTGNNPAAPAVTATFNGQLRGIQLQPSGTVGSTRKLSVTIGGASNSSDFSVPGLYPVAIQNAADPSRFAVTNLAVQPTYTPPTVTRIPVGSVPASSAPSDVAINPATGMAVVANKGSNDISLIDLTTVTPTLITNICTAAQGSASSSCPASGPTSVSIYDNSNNNNSNNNNNFVNLAIVVNSTSKTIVVVDLDTRAVISVLPVLQDTPVAVAINPVTGRALVAMQNKTYGVLVDLFDRTGKLPVYAPHYAGVVSISTGPSPRVAVEPQLNWAVATPGGSSGGAGVSLGIVDLSQQTTNAIADISRTSNVVTVTVQSPTSTPALSVLVGDTVQISQNVQFTKCLTTPSDPDCQQASTFSGFYTVTSVGPGPNQFSYTQTGQTFPDVATQAAPLAASGMVNYSQPVAVEGLPATTQGIAINPETQQAVLADPTTGGVFSFFSLIDQSLSPLSLKLSNGSFDVGTNAAAYNPLTNTVVAVNFSADSLSVIDPTAPRRLNDSAPYDLNTNTPCASSCGPVAIAIDPGTNIAVVANQTDNSVGVLNLGAIQTFSITETSPKTVVTMSTLAAGPSPVAQILTVIGKGLTCANGNTTLSVHLDDIALPTHCIGTGDRQLTATVGSKYLTSARQFAVQVLDSSTNRVTNAEAFTVEQSVDVTGCSSAPEPMGVAVDPEQNLAAVSLFGCNSLALIDLATGIGKTFPVGSNPIGVAVIPRLGVVAVANNGGAGTASIINYAHKINTIPDQQTVATGSGPMGAGADDATGQFAIANSIANTVTVVNPVTGGTSSVSTGLQPIAAAFNYVNGQLAVAAPGSNFLGISGGTSGSTNQNFSVNVPTSVIYDPVPEDCGSNSSNGTTTNTTGCFLVNSSTGNSLDIIDPVSSIQNVFRIGINPTAIAYNYRTGTLVSTNTASHTISVADLPSKKIRAVLSLPTATNPAVALLLAITGVLQYPLDIQPFTNIAVIGDTANGHVLLVPLPR
jgi:DNA-binding beta-propeller fold protein YncE